MGSRGFSLWGKKLFFTLMIATMLLPGTTMIIPRYILFNQIGWLDTYWPFIMPMAFATVAFNNFMLITFFRDLPESLDEAATIDGANSWQILTRIYVPLSKTSIVTIGLFIFIGNWNNFFEPLIYISSQEKFTLPLALQMTFTRRRWSGTGRWPCHSALWFRSCFSSCLHRNISLKALPQPGSKNKRRA